MTKQSLLTALQTGAPLHDTFTPNFTQWSTPHLRREADRLAMPGATCMSRHELITWLDEAWQS